MVANEAGPVAIRPKTRHHVFLACLAVLLTMMLLWAANASLLAMDIASQSLLLIMTYIALTLAVIHLSPKGIGAAASIYLVVYGLFQLGLPFLLATHANYNDLLWVQRTSDWLFDERGRYAMNLALAGGLACALGMLVSIATTRRPKRAPSAAAYGDAIYVQAGFVILAMAVIAWLYQAMQWGVIGASYLDWREARAEGGAIPVDSAIAWGCVLIATGRPSPLQRAGYVLFGLWALMAFVAGYRGEVLFPLGTIAMLSAKRLPRQPLWRFAVVLAAVLVIIPLGRAVRTVGLNAAMQTEMEYSTSPLDAIGEMGGSLAPLERTISWVEAGDPYLNGAGYWVPFERVLANFIPGYPPPPPVKEDPRVPAYSRTSGGIGFSVIADAFYNFGVPGIIVIMLATGLLMGWMDKVPLTPFHTALAGIIFYPILVEVRNQFLNVPKRVIFGVVILLVIHQAGRAIQSRRARMRRSTVGLSFPQQVESPKAAGSPEQP